MKIVLTTTFRKLHDAGACKERYRYLAKALGGITKYGRTQSINLLQILEHNGLNDFFWVLGTIEENEVFRLMAADFAESVLPIFEREQPKDDRPRLAIQATRQYARGEISDAAWAAASDAAWAAASDAAWAAARAAARAAAGAAAWAAAGAAGDAAWAAAWAAARAAAFDKYLKITIKVLEGK